MGNNPNGQTEHITNIGLVNLANSLAKEGKTASIVEDRKGLMRIVGVYISVPNGSEGKVLTYYIPNASKDNFTGMDLRNTQAVIEMVQRQEGYKFIGTY